MSDSGYHPAENPDRELRKTGVFYCVNCGAEMTQRSCKVRCLRCGVFEDCSDGGNDPTNYAELWQK